MRQRLANARFPVFNDSDFVYINLPYRLDLFAGLY